VKDTKDLREGGRQPLRKTHTGTVERKSGAAAGRTGSGTGKKGSNESKSRGRTAGERPGPQNMDQHATHQVATKDEARSELERDGSRSWKSGEGSRGGAGRSGAGKQNRDQEAVSAHTSRNEGRERRQAGKPHDRDKVERAKPAQPPRGPRRRARCGVLAWGLPAYGVATGQRGRGEWRVGCRRRGPDCVAQAQTVEWGTAVDKRGEQDNPVQRRRQS